MRCLSGDCKSLIMRDDLVLVRASGRHLGRDADPPDTLRQEARAAEKRVAGVHDRSAFRNGRPPRNCLRSWA